MPENEVKTYDASSIRVLEGLEAVRVRPGMYIGDLAYAVYQMLLEVVDNCVDEYSAGHANTINIKIEGEKFIVRDNGRGIPIDQHTTGKTALEIIMTVLHSGGKFDDKSYKYSGGLHGVGISVVNALSENLTARVFKNNKIYEMKFSKGDKVSDLEIVGETKEHGTEIEYTPDWSIIHREMPTFETIQARLSQLSYLNKNLKINLNYNGKKEEFFAAGGIKDYLIKVCENIETEIFIVESEQVNVVFSWQRYEKDNIISFTNNIYQADGGTHCTGFRNAITDSIMHYLSLNNIKTDIIREDVKTALVAIISFKMNEPQFSSQTKTKLVSGAGRTLVEKECKEFFAKWLEEHPKASKDIIARISRSAAIRKASSEIKEIKLQDNLDFSTILAGKLIDCSSPDRMECELFIVEGGSAAGTGKAARDKRYQAIFPVQGKLLNVERATTKQIYEFEEIKALIGALRTNIKENFDITKLRYGKIIIMTDADVDGAHIFTLIITFFMKCMPELVKAGHLYIARTPLYKITYHRNDTYVKNDLEFEDYIINHFLLNNNVNSNGKTYSVLEMKNLVSQINDLNYYLSNFIINSEIAALYLSHEKNFSDYAKRFYDYDAKILNNKLHLTSVYGEQIYILPDLTEYFNSHENKFENFSITINDKSYYDVISFLHVFNKLSRHGLSIQRYKGLGEMNAEELAVTSFEEKYRFIQKLECPEDQFDDIVQNITAIMGNEEKRRDMVLSNIARLINDQKLN